jgi:hypothetical protein
MAGGVAQGSEPVQHEQGSGVNAQYCKQNNTPPEVCLINWISGFYLLIGLWFTLGSNESISETQQGQNWCSWSMDDLHWNPRIQNKKGNLFLWKQYLTIFSM